MISFSIIIPLYNKERHIERALNSIFSQTYSNYEIIVVDDGSTDKSPDIVNRISREKDLKILRQKNAGVSSARNIGINEAKYDYIALLDADDAWKPMFLEKILSLINKFPQAGAYVTAYDIMNKEERKIIPKHKYIPQNNQEIIIPDYFKSMIYGAPMITSSSICLKKETFVKCGYFPEAEKLGEDKDMWVRVALEYPIAFSWYTGATYFENADNRTCLKYVPNYERFFIRTLQNKLDSKEVPLKFEKNVRKYISKNLIHLAAKNIKTGNPAFAKIILKDKRCKVFPFRKTIWQILSLIPSPLLFRIIKIIKYLRDYPLYYFKNWIKLN